MAPGKLTGQRILVTGFTGRLGGAFAEYLAADNEVTGVALDASDEALASWGARGVDPYVVDLAADDYGGLPADFDYVVHTAAAVYPKDFEGGMRANAEVPALLMRHTRSARAFLHVSTSGVYVEHDDPWYRAAETDIIGGSKLMGHYTGTKAAGEGAVRAMARVLNLPTVICRMDVQYGTYADGGLPVMFLANIINGVPIVLPKSYDWVKALIHQDDLRAFIHHRPRRGRLARRPGASRPLLGTTHPFWRLSTHPLTASAASLPGQRRPAVVHRAGQRALQIMLLASRNSSSPYSPRSTPRPLFL